MRDRRRGTTTRVKLREPMPKKRQQRPLEAAPRRRMSFGPSANPALTDTILAVVDQQMRDQNPPETQRTFEPFVALGYASEDARRVIGNVVA